MSDNTPTETVTLTVDGQDVGQPQCAAANVLEKIDNG